MTDFILLIAIVIFVVINIILTLVKRQPSDQSSKELKQLEKTVSQFETIINRVESSIKEDFKLNRTELDERLQANRTELSKTLFAFEEKLSKDVKGMEEMLKSQFNDFGKQQVENNKTFLDSVKDVRTTIDKQLSDIRSDNNKQITEMRATVDEKLQSTLEKRIGESFKQVSERLEEVHKGLGEMQTIATGVGDLKKVLTNVKTRGVMGEYQLENILEQMLAPEQYAKNVATKKGSQANVEFALRLPGKDDHKDIWVPIDSKFPIEDYQLLLDTFERGDKAEIETSQKLLIKKIELFAKTISEKYIDPPHTTDFAIMFLPVESLYAEVLRHPGLFENLQRKHKITVTGPTTLSAFLSSLQMGFRTLAVQKRSSEVWDILKAVKKEFGEFSTVLEKAHKQIDTASTTLDTLRTTRTNVMQRKLKDVENIAGIESKEILELPEESNAIDE